MAKSKAVVLIIDDENGRPTQRLIEDSVQTIVRHPNDVSEQDLRRAKLVLVDYELADWDERDEQETPSLQPQTGVALIAVLRSNIAPIKASPTAFALNSGMLHKLSGGGGEWRGREHAIAKSIDLEWVFGKGGSATRIASSVCSLAEAVADLPKEWIADSVKAKTLDLLALPKKAAWRYAAISEIDRSQPPHEILLRNSSGIALLRWLLHSIQPHPTFLIDERYLAARLRIDPSGFSKALEGSVGSKIKKLLGPFEYKGILSGFSSTRWWRAGIEHWIWKNTSGDSFGKKAIEELVQKKISKSLVISSIANPVIQLDEHLRPTDTLIDLSTAIEIKPDGWPAFADNAWAHRDLANDPAFNALVPQSEKAKLSRVTR